jgi:hypothetical protein
MGIDGMNIGRLGILAGGYMDAERMKNCVVRWAYWLVDIYIQI